MLSNLMDNIQKNDRRRTFIMSMTYGLQLPQGFLQELKGIEGPIEAYEALTRVAQVAEESGYASIWTADHFQTQPEPTQETFFECWTTTAALARDTRRIRVGQMVTANSYRNPALQAKMASTVDVLSHGRFTFGIGAGYYEPDYRTYGYEYPDGATRVRQLREAVQVILALWTEQEATFEGKYYQVRNAINQPKGVQRPHIPLMIAGFGEQVLLKIVAQYADAYNTIGDAATVAHKFAVLKQHCETVGRDYENIHRTAVAICGIGETDEEARALFLSRPSPIIPGDVFSYGLIGSIETIRRRLAAFEEAGVQELILWLPDTAQLKSIRQFAKAFIR
jgi:F420-dependent oxidoreductase-like protein